LRRLVGATVQLLSAAGVVGCVAGIVGVWVFRQNASEKVKNLSARLEVGLRRASAANENVRRALEKARADLAQVGKESADLGGGGGEKSRRASGAVRLLVRQQVGPNLTDLGGRLATFADAAVAVSSLLQSLQELPPGRSGRSKPDDLGRWADQATQLSASLRRLQAVVGDGDKEVSKEEVVAASGEVDLVLQKGQATVDEWQSGLDAAREEVPRVKAEILGWLTPAAVAVTAVCVWVAVSQISLFAHARKWGRGA
jgi:hypothetical protein